MQEEQLYAESGQDERTSIYQSYCVFAFPFSKKKNLKKARYIASTEISYQKSLSTEGFLLEEK